MKPAYWDRAKRALAKNDPVMGAIVKRFPRIHMVSRGDPFQTLARSIVGQQISVKAAQSVWERLVGELGEVTPARALDSTTERLRACGLSGRKVEYLVDLAGHFDDGRLEPSRWGLMEDEAVIAELVEVRGIGRWTAEMFLMFRLHRPDVLPVDDLGIVNAVQRLYRLRKRPDAKKLNTLGEAWRPYRSVASWYLWQSLKLEP